MSRRKRRQTPEWKWEQALIDDYYDYRWREVLNPLYEKFKRWEAGELTHEDMDQAIHETHKQDQELYSLFTQSRSFLVGMIQWAEEWFEEWVADHPPPEGVQLMLPRARLFSSEEEPQPNDDPI
jgi:hypothetical protein